MKIENMRIIPIFVCVNVILLLFFYELITFGEALILGIGIVCFFHINDWITIHTEHIVDITKIQTEHIVNIIMLRKEQ